MITVAGAEVCLRNCDHLRPKRRCQEFKSCAEAVVPPCDLRADARAAGNRRILAALGCCLRSLNLRTAHASGQLL